MKLYGILLGLLFSLTPPAYAGLKVITYNLGLAHSYVPFAKERLPHLIKALTASSADVLCLQEVWLKKDRQVMKKALADSYPYQYAMPIRKVKASGWPPTCGPFELGLIGKDRKKKFVGCMLAHCSGLKGDESTQCLINGCGQALENLKEKNRECAASMMAQVGKPPWLGVLTVLNPLWNAEIFVYGGSDGMMLLSKHPLSEQRFLDLEKSSSLNKRGALMAKVNVEGKKYQIMCTHLSANFDGKLPYTGIYKNWAEENKVQFGSLLEELNDVSLPTVLLGDFNCGLSYGNPSLKPNLAASCRQIAGTGFVNVLAGNGPECTYCSNAINNLNDLSEKDRLIDHVYVRGATPFSSKVIFKQKVPIGKKGHQVLTNLSDHFGVLVELD